MLDQTSLKYTSFKLGEMFGLGESLLEMLCEKLYKEVG